MLDQQCLAELISWFEEHCLAERIIPASALRGDNVASVLEWVVSKLPESPSLYPKVVLLPSGNFIHVYYLSCTYIHSASCPVL